MESLTIGQLARRAGVGVETIRFYEREGLISEPPRRPSGYRDYPLETVARIVFIVSCFAEAEGWPVFLQKTPCVKSCGIER